MEKRKKKENRKLDVLKRPEHGLPIAWLIVHVPLSVIDSCISFDWTEPSQTRSEAQLEPPTSRLFHQTHRDDHALTNVLLTALLDFIEQILSGLLGPQGLRAAVLTQALATCAQTSGTASGRAQTTTAMTATTTGETITSTAQSLVPETRVVNSATFTAKDTTARWRIEHVATTTHVSGSCTGQWLRARKSGHVGFSAGTAAAHEHKGVHSVHFCLSRVRLHVRCRLQCGRCDRRRRGAEDDAIDGRCSWVSETGVDVAVVVV